MDVLSAKLSADLRGNIRALVRNRGMPRLHQTPVCILFTAMKPELLLYVRKSK